MNQFERQQRKLFSLQLSDAERAALQELAEAHGYVTAAPFLRRFIVEQAQKAKEQQAQKEQAYA